MAPQDSDTQPSIATAVSIERYSSGQKSCWNELVNGSRNGTFLFLRDYMDYMQDRIEDCSLLVRDSRGHLIAVLPGHVEGDTYLSHARLTYGGFVTDESMRLPVLLQVFDACIRWLSDAGMRTFVYKTIPHIYHRLPAEDDRYALFLLGAKWVRSGMLAVIHKRNRGEYQDRRRRTVKKAKHAGLNVRTSNDYATYWRMLTDLLQERYDTRPVHSIEEIEHLRRSFPKNIELYACYAGDTMLAGIVVYSSARVVRAQYIASCAAGRKAGALDLVVDHLITQASDDDAYIDLGTSDEQSGQILNEGLIEWKEGFGARAVALDQYRIDLTAWRPGMLNGALR